MKKKQLPILIITLMLFLNLARAQTIDYNSIILPSEAKNISIEEKLVQLAWNNNPTNQIEINNLLISAKQVKIYTADWLNIFGISANVNEFNLNPETAPDNFFYPRYNIGASINLGLFVENPIRRGIAKLNMENQQQRINAKKLEVRAEVLVSYQRYKLSKEALKIQLGFTSDAQSNFIIAEQQFKDGMITLAEYNESLQMYNNQILTKLQKESDYQIAKIELESIVGVTLDRVLENE